MRTGIQVKVSEMPYKFWTGIGRWVVDDIVVVPLIVKLVFEIIIEVILEWVVEVIVIAIVAPVNYHLIICPFVTSISGGACHVCEASIRYEDVDIGSLVGTRHVGRAKKFGGL